ncbi:MAG: hypothetical protein IKB16_01660, partial [Lentisphaeria bacterium]|nr:hypothetical protein [Lentisphaeria bacterium]
MKRFSALSALLLIGVNLFAANLPYAKSFPITLPGRAIPALADPVFSNMQMEKGAPKLQWKNISALEQETVLTKTAAGLDLDGVTLIRQIKAEQDRITLRFTLKNTTKHLRYVSFGFRSNFRIGQHGIDVNYIPTENNVLDLDYQNALWNYYTKPGEWHYNLVEPWYAVLNKNRTGVAFLADYNVLVAAYLSNNMRIRGMMLDGGMLPPGKTFSTVITVLPLKHLNSIATVTEQFSAGFGSDRNLQLEILPSRDGTIKGNVVVKEVTGKELGRTAIQITGRKMQTASIPLQAAKPATQTVNFCILNGIPFEQYRENGFRTQPLPMVPPVFTHKRNIPPKKADTAAGNQIQIKQQKKALLLFGFYANFFRFDKIFKNWKLNTISARPQGIPDIPPATTIGEYSFILLGNVNYESVRPMISRLESYVRNGGNLVVCGGPFAYGCGGYDGTVLEKLLPVIPKPFDLRPAAGDRIYDKAVSFSLPGKDTPQLWWLHKVQCKPGSEILLNAGN